jgi:hypothetical protein
MKFFLKDEIYKNEKELCLLGGRPMMITRHPIQFILIPLGILFPLLMLDIAINNPSYARIPDAASVQTTRGGGVLIKNVGSSSVPVGEKGRTRDGKQAELRNPKDVLTVDGDNYSNAFFISVPKGMKAYTKPSNTQTTYKFPCGAEEGGLVVGWQKGKKVIPCSPPGMRIKSSSRNYRSYLSTPIKVAEAVNDRLITQLSLSQLQFMYCSVAAKGYGWWTRWGTWTDDYYPCQEAEQECLRHSSSENCVVVSMGDWSAQESDLLVSVECANNRILTDRGNGVRVAKVLIEQLAEQAKMDGEKACAINVFSSDDLLVAPASNGTTLIQTQDSNGNIEVDALAGNVIIRSEKKPGGILVRVGNRYTYPQDSLQPINVSEIAQSPDIQAFLDNSNWPTDSSDIDEYRAALGREEEVGSGSKSDSGSDSGIKPKVVIDILWNVWGMLQPTSRSGNSQYPSSSPSISPDSW